MTNNPEDGRSYLITVGLLVTVHDSLDFRAARASFGERNGELVMEDQIADLPLVSRFIGSRIVKDGLWDVAGATVKLHSLAGTSYKSQQEDS